MKHVWTAWLTLAALAAGFCRAQSKNYFDAAPPPQIVGLDVDEHLGRTLPLELVFTTNEGKQVSLGEYFKAGDKPAVIMLVYYDCPVVCDVLLSKQAQTLDGVDYTVGKDYRVLIFSFDPDETAEQAAKAKAAYTAEYRRRDQSGVLDNYVFHVSDQETSRALADALGFRYRRLADGNYSHPLCQFVIGPDGKIARYLYGYSQDPRDMKLALLEASQGRLSQSIGDRLAGFCYLYDPAAGKYTLRALRVMQLGGLVTIAGLGTLIVSLFIGERLRKVAMASGRGTAGAGHGLEAPSPSNPDTGTPDTDTSDRA